MVENFSIICYNSCLLLRGAKKIVQRDEYLAVEFYPESPRGRSGGMTLANGPLVSIHAEICTYIRK